MKRRPVVMSIALLALIAAVGSRAVAWAQQTPEAQPKPPQQERRGFPDLVGGLRGTPGCLGVETARTSGGKNAIFAWFKDKESIKGWYYSEVHQGVMDAFVTGDESDQTKPLAHVKDDAGPILVIASLTPSQAPAFPGVDIPVSQIAIELYEALPGGVFLGGRFAPPTVKVAHMRDYTPPAEMAAP